MKELEKHEEAPSKPANRSKSSARPPSKVRRGLRLREVWSFLISFLRRYWRLVFRSTGTSRSSGLPLRKIHRIAGALGFVACLLGKALTFMPLAPAQRVLAI